MREVISRLEWGEEDAVFRLERVEHGGVDRATLVLPGGEHLDLREHDWRQLAVAIQRLFPGRPVSASRKDVGQNAGKPWPPHLDDELRAAWEESGKDDEAVGLLATRFGRSKGGIRARLGRLGLTEPDQAT